MSHQVNSSIGVDVSWVEKRDRPVSYPAQKYNKQNISQKKELDQHTQQQEQSSIGLRTTYKLQNGNHNYQPEFNYLKSQIQQLQQIDKQQTKLRYQSEVFVLKKRRNNLFRGFEKKKNLTHKSLKDQKCINFDQIIDQSRPMTKNAMKINKLLTKMIERTYQPCKQKDLLDFLSQKHRIPLQTCKQVIQTIAGYNESKIKKINKYQLNTEKIPILGNSINFENSIKQQCQINKEQQFTIIIESGQKLYDDQIECFINIPQFNGYLLPQENLDKNCFENKNQIFKVSRLIQRFKMQKQSILKKLAYLCVKQVEQRLLKSTKTQNEYVIRAKKLYKQSQLYWRKRQKQLTELKKKKEKLELELKKRDEQQQEAKKQQKRLQYIMYQSGLYSHFMATKLGMGGQQKKQLISISQKPIGIDQQAALLDLNQLINNKQDNLEKYDNKKQGSLDLSAVDQGTISSVGAPQSFCGILKEYQIKGLRWLNNLFQQGINGILADQMGLGKTIQAIALLAHISVTKNVWGPFLIVAPNSTLYNWQQQFLKFCPSLKVLPYWGTIRQRKTIRKFFSFKKFTQKSDSPFHVVITSYQLTVTDDKTFKRLKWKFMILDQAQAIKNILSQRWNTLKVFQSRNRLLLTGTPIQNNMAQLWALLNFVMPDLFDSHELFNQWFSKDIQAHSQNQKDLDQIKIQRLHAILKPFMLRRMKKDVQDQIGKKFQHQILCEMTKRQKLLYESIKQKLNVKELFKMFESKVKVQNLMNLVMQLRKVCNHPQLFERRPPRSPFLFQQLYYYTGYMPIRLGDIKLLNYHPKNPIQLTISRIMYDQLIRYKSKTNKQIINIFTVQNQINNPTFSSTKLIDLSYSQIDWFMRQDLLLSGLYLIHWMLRSKKTINYSIGQYIDNLCNKIDNRFIIQNQNYKFIQNIYIINVTAPCIQLQISSLAYKNQLELIRNNKYQKYIMQGLYQQQYKNYLKIQNYKGIISNLNSLSNIEIVDFGNLVADSSKLKQLDKILKEKKKNNDKVLIFCQMTKMIDILEDFMNLRKYTFFRLDGASNIADRRDMVNQFQKPTSKIFVFLLSTRAGGLGVTLTAANTVIFYDNDWNPTMDAQATDRAHRIGQSQDVNVYQLVTKGTIQQRIVKRAQQKKNVQSTVYQGASFNFFKREMIYDLMVDEFNTQNPDQKKKETKKKGNKGNKNKQEMQIENKMEKQQ